MSVGITGNDLAVEHCRLGRQLVQQLRDGREAVREVVPVAAEEHHTRAHLVGLHTVAVELYLVHPAVAGRHALGGHGAAGWYETELGHLSGCNGIPPAGATSMTESETFTESTRRSCSLSRII